MKNSGEMRSVSTRYSYSLQKQIGYSKEKRRDFEVSFELHSNRPLSPRLQTMTEINYWLMKSEPDVYGIQQLEKEKTTLWDGIRNYQARNFMRSMKIKDIAFFYHSNCKPPEIVGIMEVIRTKIIDPTQFDPSSKYFDPKSDRANPRWDCSEMKLIKKFPKSLTLHQLKEIYSPDELGVVRRGNRLSILPVPQKTARDIIKRIDL